MVHDKGWKSVKTADVHCWKSEVASRIQRNVAYRRDLLDSPTVYHTVYLNDLPNADPNTSTSVRKQIKHLDFVQEFSSQPAD